MYFSFLRSIKKRHLLNLSNLFYFFLKKHFGWKCSESLTLTTSQEPSCLISLGLRVQPYQGQLYPGYILARGYQRVLSGKMGLLSNSKSYCTYLLPSNFPSYIKKCKKNCAPSVWLLFYLCLQGKEMEWWCHMKSCATLYLSLF